MNWKGSQGAEARLSAREAVKIRAALAESVNTSTMYEAYLSTSPHSSGNIAQDRARARAWAIMNVRVNLEAVKLVLLRIWATGYLIGELSADEIYAQARRAQKSAMITKKETPRAISMDIDWDSWTPGDQVTATLLKPPKAFRRLLDASGVTIKGINSTTLNDIGNALGESVALGLAPKQAAKLIRQSVGSPARALTISITEMRRAVSTATIERYRGFGLTQMRWVTFTPCDKCEMNDQVVADIGAPFPSGDTQTPAHPNCQCRLAPVIPDDVASSSTSGQVTMTGVKPKPIDNPDALYNQMTYQRNQGFRANRVPFAQESALDTYTSAPYLNIQSVARTGRDMFDPTDKAYAEEIKVVIDNLSKLIQSAPPLPADLLTYRGIQGEIARRFSTLKPGEIIQDKGFTSTSLLREKAEVYTTTILPGQTKLSPHTLILEIINPAGTRGVAVEGFFDDIERDSKIITNSTEVAVSTRTQYEWLLDRNTPLEVVANDGKVLTVRVKP